MSITTGELSKKLQVQKTSVSCIAERYNWKPRQNPYKQGFIWDVTEEDIATYHEDKRAETLTYRQKLDRFNDVIDLWDTAFSGRTFPRGGAGVKLKLPVSFRKYVLDKAPGEIDEYSNTPSRKQVKQVRMPNSKHAVAVISRIAELLLDGYYHPDAVYDKLKAEGLLAVRKGEVLSLRCIKQRMVKIRTDLKLKKYRMQGHVIHLHERGYTPAQIIARTNTTYDYANRYIKYAQAWGGRAEAKNKWQNNANIS